MQTLLNAKPLAILFILLFIKPASALDSFSFEIEQVKTKDWQLNNISFALLDLQNSSQQLTLLIRRLSLPEPFADVKVADIQCSQFSWQENKIDCKKGKARLKSHAGYSNAFTFSFSLTDKKSSFSIKNFKQAGGDISLTAQEQGKHWSVSIKTKNLKLKSLTAYLSKENKKLADIAGGRVNAELKASGNDSGLKSLLINALFKQVSLQANQGKTALESVDLEWDLQAKLNKGEWQWQNFNHIQKGELYQEPVYLKIEDKGVSIKVSGTWDGQNKIQMRQATFNHQDVIELKTHGLIKHTPGFRVNQAHISAKINSLELFSAHYLLPFFEQTALEGFKLQGQLNAQLDIKQSALTQVSADIQSLSVTDDKNRFAINKARGLINWSNNPAYTGTSKIQWDQIKIRAIPVEASQLYFLFKQKQFTLLKQTSIPLLDGTLDIKQFKWQNIVEDEPKVYFEGGINQLSLEKLSYVLNWTPLSGNISGYIPGVNYEDKTLTVNGELLVKLFGGTVKINKLSSSGLFTDFSKFSMEMEIENLDLYEITQKFKMGGMEGRISGYINNLYLENWQPVTFYAWLGTPENDSSRHRISQKAVENIASIGGGGAADIISKGFLRFFDTFNYDRLGFGCYLHQGVCQLMGVEAAEQGYYLVKGGGIPRIDIMGYNTQVDWNVLMERLSRITSTDEVVIE